jgi:signal transduction histidine kinase
MPAFSLLFRKLEANRIAIGFGLAMVLVGFGFSMSYLSYTRSQYDNQRVRHSYEVSRRLESVLSLLKDVETASRGYALTGDSLFLSPYFAARPQFVPQLDNLVRLVSDNPTQQQAADTLRRLVEARLAVNRKQIQLPRSAPMSLRQTYMREGKRYMDRVREQVARMMATEDMLMAARNATAKNSYANTLVIVGTLSVLTFVVLITLYNLLTNELHRRAETEAQLRAYELELQEKITLLEASNRELERMAFIASHDMQEPLRKIQAFGGLLTERFSLSLEEDGRLFLSKIITSADRMATLIRDLLNFSRIGNRRDSFEAVDLNALLDRIVGELDFTIRETGAVVQRTELPTIEAVPGQMEQLFTNLISNALKYVRPNVPAKVTIATVPVFGSAYAGLLPNEPYVRLIVSDNGIGFNEKYLDRIFEIFQRLHNQAQYPGTGIGLAICKRIVTYHNGHITARSQEGVGTSFEVVLPVKQAAGLSFPTTLAGVIE